MAEISQAARDYLTALEKKRQELEKSRGSATAEAFVKGQKEQGKKLLNKDRSGMEAAAQNRLRGSVVSKPEVKKIPGNVKRNNDPVMVRKRTPQTAGAFFKDTFNGQGPFKPVSADKKAQNAAEQKAYEEANAARAARRKK